MQILLTYILYRNVLNKNYSLMCLLVTDTSAHRIPLDTGCISFTLVLDLCLRPYVATVVVHLRNSPMFLSGSSLSCTAVTSEGLYILTPVSTLSGTSRCLCR